MKVGEIELKGKWRVQSNLIGSRTMYIVFRLRNVNQVQHSGNMEHIGTYTENREEAQAMADKLNEQEVE